MNNPNINVEIQNLKVYYKEQLMVCGKDYIIENRQIKFKNEVNRRYVKITYETIIS